MPIPIRDINSDNRNESESVGQPNTPIPFVDGQMSGDELVLELQRREDIGTILQNNPQADTRQILYGLDLQHLSFYSPDFSLTNLLLQKPPKAGLKDFLQELCERTRQIECPELYQKLARVLTCSIDALLNNRRYIGDIPDLCDILLALHIANALPITTNNRLQILATKTLPVLMKAAPEQVNAYTTVFGITPEAVRNASMSLISEITTIANLRSANVAVPDNDDPEFRQKALEIVQTTVQRGNSAQEYCIAYEIPKNEYDNAVLTRLFYCLSIPLDFSVEEFFVRLRANNIELRTDDPEIRNMLLKYINDMYSFHGIDRVLELQNTFSFTAREMSPFKDLNGERYCREIMRSVCPDITLLRTFQALIHMTDSELKSLVQDCHLIHLNTELDEISDWETIMCNARLLTTDIVRQDIEKTYRSAIVAGNKWSIVKRCADRLGGLPIARLSADETRLYGQDLYLSCLEMGKLTEVANIEMYCDLSHIRGTPRETEAAKSGMANILTKSFVDVKGARKIQQQFGFTDCDLQRAAEEGALKLLGFCWYPQLEVLRSEFNVEEVFRSEQARQVSAKVVSAFLVEWLTTKRHFHDIRRDTNDELPFLTQKHAEIVLRCIAIGGYDADGIERALRGRSVTSGGWIESIKLLPRYEAEHLPTFLLLLRGCPEAFKQAFSRDDVREYAETEYLVPALASGDEAAAQSHIELTSFPRDRLQEIGNTAFENFFRSERYTHACTAARICSLDNTKVAEMFAAQMRADHTKVLPHLDGVPARVLNRLEREFHLRSYTDKIGIPSAAIYSHYVELVRQNDPLAVTAFVSSIKEQLNRVTSGGRQDASISTQPFYRDIIEVAYPNNAQNWTSFGNNEACEDRTGDLATYTVRDNYNFTVAPGQDMVLKDGFQKNRDGFTAIHTPLEQIHKKYESTGFERDPMLAFFDQELASETANLTPAEAYTNREEKICGLFLQQMQGTYPLCKLMHVLISYQYAAFQDIREYLQGTRARVEQSRNPEYTYLLELREFFADRLKDVVRKILESALLNPALRAQLPQYFQRCRANETARTEGQEVARLQIDKLGLAPGFIKKLCANLQRRTGRAYSEDEARALIREYEDRTAGLAEAAIPEGVDAAIAGQIRAQRTKTIRAMCVLTGINVHPSEIRLEDIHLQELLNERRSIVSGEYDEEVFGSYMGRRFGEVFDNEISFIDAEIAKYEAKDATGDTKAKRIEAFITKNHTSAHARATTGVCVSGDNPWLNEETQVVLPNQWQQPNYLQMILRDSETKLCKGCVLMHVVNDGDKKILTASMNPSSTYLYQVNEEEMFRNLLSRLILFANDNQFDAIAVSTDKHIRTNRTGGLFERAMDKAIADTMQSHILSTECIFSYNPFYQQKELDFIWVANPKEEHEQYFKG